jgi:hypothetical protein
MYLTIFESTQDPRINTDIQEVLNKQTLYNHDYI